MLRRSRDKLDERTFERYERTFERYERTFERAYERTNESLSRRAWLQS